MLTVRAATPDDAEAIADVQIRGWQWAYDGLMPADRLAGLEVTRPERIGRWRRILTDLDPCAFVALDAEGRVVGFVIASTYREDQDESRPVDGVGEVHAIYVYREVAGMGAGRALMDAAVNSLTDRGLNPIRLWVLEANTRARRFYERYGFALDGARSTAVAGSVELPEVRYTLATDGQPDQ
jgi:ribosomal protein S18 acetylase RimI-like enzyme